MANIGLGKDCPFTPIKCAGQKLTANSTLIGYSKSNQEWPSRKRNSHARIAAYTSALLHMMFRPHVWLILVLFHLDDSIQSAIASTPLNDAVIHTYSYTSTVTSPNHTSIGREIKGIVLVKVRSLSSKRKPSGAAPGAHRHLIHLLVDLEDTDGPLQALVLREESGLVQRVFLPAASETDSSDVRLNFVKAIAGLFNYHIKFEPGVEYDSSGRCQTYYAEVADSPMDKFDPEETIVVDKQKLMCSPISKPLDAGVRSVSPILKQKHISHNYMRFFLQRKTGLLTRAKTIEQHQLSFDLDDGQTEENSIIVIGEQKLDILPEGAMKNTLIDRLGSQMKGFPKDSISAVSIIFLLLRRRFNESKLRILLLLQGMIKEGLETTSIQSMHVEIISV